MSTLCTQQPSKGEEAAASEGLAHAGYDLARSGDAGGIQQVEQW